MNILEFRKKYPQYSHVKDGELARALHKKHYSHVPMTKFLDAFMPEDLHKPEVPQVSALEAGISAVGQGAGMGFVDEIGGAVRAGIDKIRGSDKPIGELYRARRDEYRGFQDQASQQHPGITTAGEVGGAVLAGGAGAAKAGVGAVKSVGQLMRKGAGVGAGLGAAGGLGYSEGETAGQVALDTAKGAAAGGAVGAALPAVASVPGKVAQYAAAKSGVMTDSYRGALGVLEKHGIDRLTRGQAANAKGLRSVETSLAELPLVGRPLIKTIQGTRKAYQKRLLELAGLKDGSELINTKTMDRLHKKLSRDYDDLLSNSSVRLQSDDFLAQVDKIEGQFLELADFEQARNITRVLEGLKDQAAKSADAGGIPGPAYQRMRSWLGKKARATRDETTSGFYRDLQTALDDEFARSAGGTMGRALKELNKRWAHFSQLDDLSKGRSGAEAVEGYISPGALHRKAVDAPGSDEWRELVEAAATVFPDRVPNSATATRTAILSALGIGGLGVAAPQVVNPTNLVYPAGAALGAAYGLSRGRVGPVNRIARPGVRNALVAPSGAVVPATE